MKERALPNWLALMLALLTFGVIVSVLIQNLLGVG